MDEMPFEGESDAVWSIHRRSVNSVLVYEPRPGARSTRPRVWNESHPVAYRINSLGLRDRDGLTREKPPGSTRVVCLGDSVTFGLEVDLEAIAHNVRRVVEIVGLDLQADGGTHVANTQEVGVIHVVKHESKGKINKRIYVALEP